MDGHVALLEQVTGTHPSGSGCLRMAHDGRLEVDVHPFVTSPHQGAGSQQLGWAGLQAISTDEISASPLGVATRGLSESVLFHKRLFSSCVCQAPL